MLSPSSTSGSGVENPIFFTILLFLSICWVSQPWLFAFAQTTHLVISPSLIRGEAQRPQIFGGPSIVHPFSRNSPMILDALSRSFEAEVASFSSYTMFKIQKLILYYKFF